MSRIALAGANGLLGRAFAVYYGENALLLSRDIVASDRTKDLIRSLQDQRIEVLVNCAAHTNVEAAEDAPDLDFEVNACLPARLASVCQQAGVTMVHFSSTGCYGTWKDVPYVETDELRPTTVHHRSKAAGEDFVRSSLARSLIVRTGWLYGGATAGKRDFVSARIGEAERASAMRSDIRQRGCPTNITDVVYQVNTLINAGSIGTFNVVAEGVASRFEYVQTIITTAGLPCEVLPGPAFKRKAQVSYNEAAENMRLNEDELNVMPHWQNALRSYVSNNLAVLSPVCDNSRWKNT